MANTLNVGNGDWATKENSLLGYNSESGNYKPLAFDFTRASSATVVNKSGLIETAANGVPRIDFLGNTNGALKLEPQRTNLITYSEDFTDSFWEKSFGGTGSFPVITSNYSISPDGTQNADRVVFDSGGTSSISNYSALSTLTISSSVENNRSVYLKSSDGNTYELFLGSTSSPSGGINVTITNQWQRFDVNHIPSGTETNFYIGTRTVVGGIVSNTADILIWGAQLEQGSYPTSYIPTQGSAVTRVQDVCSGAGNDQVINSTEGVLYADVNFKTFTGQDYFGLNDGTNTQRVLIEKNGTNVNCYVGSVTLTGAISSLSNKIAVKWKLNDFKMYINGIEVSNITSGTVPIGLDRLDFKIGGGLGLLAIADFKDVRVYNTALSDAELIALTS